MKIFWSWQCDTPGKTGRFLVRDALRDAIEKLREAPDIEDAVRDALHLDQDIQGVTGSPDLARTIFGKIERSEVVVADVTLVGATGADKKLINSNVAIELGYALHARTEDNVLLVFNEYYGGHEDLPFDLRHKGGAIVFSLAADAGREDIETQKKALKDKFSAALKPFLERRVQQHRKEPSSLRANIKHERVPVPGGGGDDERYRLLVGVENQGEQDATDFKLDVDFPSSFLDEGGHSLKVGSAIPGFERFRITNRHAACQMDHLYPGDKTRDDLIAFHYAVRGQMRRESPERLQEQVTATVFSGNMKPRKTVLSIAELTG